MFCKGISVKHKKFMCLVAKFKPMAHMTKTPEIWETMKSYMQTLSKDVCIMNYGNMIKQWHVIHIYAGELIINLLQFELLLVKNVIHIANVRDLCAGGMAFMDAPAKRSQIWNFIPPSQNYLAHVINVSLFKKDNFQTYSCWEHALP